MLWHVLQEQVDNNSSWIHIRRWSWNMEFKTPPETI